ncbi:MAG: HK97 gp10 family phage protein [Psychrilyobacter sp.]|uniref:HK97 gp10 family phage protein n=1 Tax=Psychrilyobacter sp. TaxID=2586924 RepID=UPI003C73D497
MSRNDFDDFTKDILELAIKLDKGKEVKKLMGKEGTKLKKQTKALAKIRVKKQTGKYQKSISRGKVFKSTKTDDMVVRVYNKIPKGNEEEMKKEAIKYNAIEYGRVIKGKDGIEKGFLSGKHILKDAKSNFKDEYYSDVEDFIDDMLDNHNL